ncbi:MAG: DUF488 family protein [Puniceicoccaceae bacterium]
MIQTYSYGSALGKDFLHIGVSRHLPRGVPKTEYQQRGYFDLWLPVLAPDAKLIQEYLKGNLPHSTFAKRYQMQIRKSEAQGVIAVLAHLAEFRPIALGCFCKDAKRCHRTILAQAIAARASEFPTNTDKPKDAAPSHPSFASPPCMLHEFSDKWVFGSDDPDPE